MYRGIAAGEPITRTLPRHLAARSLLLLGMSLPPLLPWRRQARGLARRVGRLPWLAEELVQLGLDVEQRRDDECLRWPHLGTGGARVDTAKAGPQLVPNALVDV